MQLALTGRLVPLATRRVRSDAAGGPFSGKSDIRLAIGAAGLLRGYRATSHWSSMEQLSLLGAEPVQERVVRDGNRKTGAGVTSGIDLALTVVAELLGHQVAQEVQLQMEYDPEPPYKTGSPRTAPSALVRATHEKIAAFIERRRIATERAAKRLVNTPE
jgi:cyclohexyl-isocyanide hydratase